MVLDAIVKRAKNLLDLEGCVKPDQICPDSINDMDHDHIDPDWSQWGGLSAIAVDAKGWFTRPVVFPAAFPSIPNWLLTSIKGAHSPGPSTLCQPSGLKVFLVPCNITTAGFTLNIDVNASCTIAGATIDVSWIARRMAAAWIS